MPGLLEQRSLVSRHTKLVNFRQEVKMKMKIVRTKTALTLEASTTGRGTRTAVSATTILRHQQLMMMRRSLAKDTAAVPL